jgi:hypothetical protein
MSLLSTEALSRSATLTRHFPGCFLDSLIRTIMWLLSRSGSLLIMRMTSLTLGVTDASFPNFFFSLDPSMLERLPNYFSLNPSEIHNTFINELLAPFQGLEKVREAHGNWAAAELALEVCAEFTAAEASGTQNAATHDNSGPSQTQIAAILDNSGKVSIDETEPVDVKLNPDRPYFAHLAMCKDPEAGKLAPIQPPLGWVLSKWTQDHFAELLLDRGNDVQLRSKLRLERRRRRRARRFDPDELGAGGAARRVRDPI